MKKIEIILLLFFLTSCSLKNKENKEINQIKLNKISIEDTSCRVSVRQINKRCYYDTVIICIYPTKAELEQFKYKPEFIQNKNKEFINALNFLKKSKVKNYMVYDSVKEYHFIIEQDAIIVNKSKYMSLYKTPWLIILFNGNKTPYISASESINEAFKDYFK